jgi:asparagine synthase (glutamine-hydrolysing)
MCGIGGILRVTKPGEAYEPIPESWLDALDAGIAWRGPDGAGRFRDRVTKPDGTIVEVALVHRRLSIIDHEGGAQPMVSERGPEGEGLVAVVFNGCIYNHRESREELEELGHRFASDHSDTEVLVHTWRQRDDLIVGFLEGMFAAVIWDRNAAELIWLRDRFGEKPLYSARLDRPGSVTVAFASAPGQLAPQAPPRLNASGLVEWLRFGFGDPATPLEGVESDPPTPIPRWRSRGAEALRRRLTGRARAENEIDEALRRSVGQRLDADVPIGCFLSGGVDSSLVSLHAARARPGITTLCVRMPDAAIDESVHAERVARIIGSDHHTIDVAPNPAGDLVRIIETLGLPFGDSSILPTYWLCKAARAHVKVALAGDGGDELFWGYERYAAAAWLGVTSRLALRPSLVRLLTRRSEPSRREKWRRLSEAARGDGYLDLVSIFPRRELRRLVGRRAARRFGEGSDGRPRGARSARDWDMSNYLPGDLMRKVDTASMLCGLEVRCPMLDSTVVELANRCPKPALRNPSNRKTLLRDLARRHFPADLIDRPKQGFAIPVGEWFRSDFGGMRTLLMDLVGSHAEANRPAFGRVHDVLDIDMRYVDRMIRDHTDQRRDHSQRLFMLCSLAIWARWLDRG